MDLSYIPAKAKNVDDEEFEADATYSQETKDALAHYMRIANAAFDEIMNTSYYKRNGNAADATDVVVFENPPTWSK